MEQARLFLAIALSLIVFFVWQYFFIDPEQYQQPQDGTKPALSEDKKAKRTDAEETGTAVQPQYVETAPATPELKTHELKTVTVITPYYEAKISNRGAVLESFKLKEYKEQNTEDSPLKEMIPEDMKAVETSFSGNGIRNLESRFFETDASEEPIIVNNSPREISFRFREDGIVFEKNYRFSPDSYLIDLSTHLKNGSGNMFRDKLVVSVPGKISEKRAYGFEGPEGFIDKELMRLKELDELDEISGEIKWIAVVDKYFMSAVISEKPAKSVMKAVSEGERIKNQFILPEIAVAPGSVLKQDCILFFGPKSMKLLGELGHNLDEAYKLGRWGMFDFIALPCLWLMNWIYEYIPNYGVAIILLTILIKILLWPLGNKGYKSMNEMKKLSPLMNEIREKYKDDRKKMNEEMMGLYRTYKINPVGGCLPMILQIPVFIAFYGMLYEAIELRHAPFGLWIDDLAAPDRLFQFGFNVPFMDNPDGIPVLTIVMGATMVLQQKMSPPPGGGDPMQAKIMTLMPIVITVIFINFPSGLVLYWLVNNILSIAQQYYISKKKS